MENCKNPSGKLLNFFYNVITFFIPLIINAIKEANEKKRIKKEQEKEIENL